MGIYEQRIERLKSTMKDNNYNAFYTSNITNVRYLSGFTGSSGFLLVIVFYLSGTISGGGFMPNDFVSSVDDATGDETPANMWVHISLLIPFIAVDSTPVITSLSDLVT